jgi:ABC-2 type transport system permease protein
MLFPFPGGLAKDDKANVEWVPLVTTGTRSGTIEVDQILGNRGDMRQLRIFEKPGNQSMVLAAMIERPAVAAPAGDDASAEAPADKPIRAIVVADIDVMGQQIFGLRNRPDEVFGLDFDNITFVLNLLDTLAGDDRFLEIRKRKPKHRTLARIEDTVAEARELADVQRQNYIAEFDKAEREANAEMQEEVGEFEKKIKEMEAGGNADPQAAMQAVQQLASRQRLAQRRLDTKLERLKRKRDAEIEQVERSLAATIRREQDWQKWLAVVLPPIPPLVVAFFVFFRRRAREREGVAKSRLR